MSDRQGFEAVLPGDCGGAGGGSVNTEALEACADMVGPGTDVAAFLKEMGLNPFDTSRESDQDAGPVFH